jgi:hypothetical protein
MEVALLRRLLIAGVAGALTGPMLVPAPSSATVLFSCSSANIETYVNPGLSHTPTAQTAQTVLLSQGSYVTGCGAGGGTATLTVNPINSYPPRPLGCPESYGGALGNNYPENTPLLIGGANSFSLGWASGPSSFGTAKVKAGIPGQLKLVFSITSGQFSPPAGQKTKLKGSIQISFVWDSASCTNDSDPAQLITFTNAGSLIVNQQ